CWCWCRRKRASSCRRRSWSKRGSSCCRRGWSKRCRSSSCSCRRKCSCGRRCECSCGCRCECGSRRNCCRRCRCRGGRGNVAVSERGALEGSAGDHIEDRGNIVSAIELHQSCAIGCLARNQNIAAQACEGGRKILVDPVGPLLIKCYRLEERATRAESARIVGN